MIKSIIDDIKHNLRIGNALTKLMLVLLILFIFTALIEGLLFNTSYALLIRQYFGLSSKPLEILFRPWTIFTNIFLTGHYISLFYTLIGLNLFGRIVGDLLGDKKLIPLYITGGINSGILAVVIYNLIGIETTQYYTSAAVLFLGIVAASLAPDYEINLLLLGPVKLKYVLAAYIFLLLLPNQTGYMYSKIGEFSSLLLGFGYMYLLRQGKDLAQPFVFLSTYVSNLFSEKKQSTPRSTLKVEYRSDRLQERQNKAGQKTDDSKQEKIDRILDKIRAKGYDTLSDDEKKLLKDMSN